jgi:alkyl hydroperoxide reductase subunit AhpC
MLRIHSNWQSSAKFCTVGIYKNRLGKIRLSDYHGKKYVILLFYPANFTSVSSTELINFK